MHWTAIVRSPGNSYVNALSGKPPDEPINIQRALQQHAAYRAALQEMGVDVILQPADERFPDGCFVEDALVVRGKRALITRSGATSRQGEGEDFKPIVKAHGFAVAQIEAPGTLDGGDVLWIENAAYVGLGARTNEEGIAQLGGKLGVAAHPIPLPPGMLHLKSGAAYLGDGRLFAVAAFADLASELGLEWIQVPEGEEMAADVLVLGQKALVPSAYPKSGAVLRGLRFQVWQVDLSEFAKADGGPTCLSIIWPQTGTAEV